MKLLHKSILGSTISISLILAGCGSGSKPTSGGGTTPPPPTSFQVTVTAPPANAGVITSAPAGIQCSGNGGDASNVCVATFASGTKVMLTATAATGYSFSGWSGGGCSGTSSCVVTVTSAVTVSPTFTATPLSYVLSISYLPSGVPTAAGAVISNPSGISCPGSCTANFANNTQVTLTAAANTGYTFSGWSGGNCSGTSTCTVNVTGAETVSPTFTSTSTSAVLTLSLAGSGTVTSSPSGISCPGSCSASFPLGTSVSLNETASANNGFIGWGGVCSGSGNCSLTLNAAATVSAGFAPNTGSLQSLNHIIIFAQENRSLDHYFGAMRQYWARAGFPDQQFDGLPQFNPQSGNIPPAYGPPPAVPGCDPALSTSTSCAASTTAPLVTSFHNIYSVCSEALSPFWNEAHVDWDFSNPIGTTAPQMNGWVQAAANDARQVTPQLHDLNGYRTMGYYDDSDLNYYYYMASTFATSDRWFAPVMSRTQLNRMFLLSGSSGGHVYPLGPPYGALTNPPIFEALQNAGITWKIYVNSGGTNCSDTDSKCLIQHSYINMFTYNDVVINNPQLLQNIVSVTQLMTDLKNGTLPQVALIEPPSDQGLDEHPTDTDAGGGVDIQSGAAFTASIMNGLMASPNWKDSAMIFTYDEPGGFYDHVPPAQTTPPDSSTSPNYLPIDLKAGDICSNAGELGTGTCSFAYTGYRLPFILVSPFAKKNYVSHTPYDHTAILKLIEKRFNLSPLSNRDANQSDMSLDFFDFVNAPWATPPTNVPTQSRTGSCNLNALPAPPPNP